MAVNMDGRSQNEEARIQIFVQQMLMTRVFVASYIGRLYVESLKTYRDVIQISGEEKKLIRDLVIVKKRIENFYRGAVWAAITSSDMMETPSGHCIWVKLKDVPFGTFWFMIENVIFSGEGEMVVRVKVLRNVETDAKHFQQEVCWSEFRNNIVHALQEILTWNNIKESVKFIFVLIFSIVTGLLYGLEYLGNYSLHFFREFNNLIHVCTPIFIAVIDLISKVIGGFYILIAMLWRGQGPPLNPAINVSTFHKPHAIKPSSFQRR